ncbi:MaoC family dehydratase [Capillimicrobium parvum]|uniref:(R)-specific enoyl-CoA hydratase n=1 Tax=Capillimicrobium parvum TaxID=2884022 RepID=A0A9E7C1Q1_9ACTN|nr:MaoC family dehydratase [Capillimicrobium parvum]UGS36929.1 (R)-specific enoyl-CoA hydratase [Capillimicrobium parvum]
MIEPVARDLRIGDRVDETRVVSAEMIALYADLSGDDNPLHLDAEYAARTPFGRPIAHGPIALALAAGILGTRLPGPGSIAITNYIRYRRPIFAGDAITTRIEVAAIDRERRCATFAMTLTNADGEVVALGEAVLRPPGY